MAWDGSPGVQRSIERTLGHLRTLGTADTGTPEEPLTLETLYRQQRMQMVRLVILLVDPAATEDVVQEAFTELYRDWKRLRDSRAAIGHLRTAVVNGSRSVLRRRKTAREYQPPHRPTLDWRSHWQCSVPSTRLSCPL